MDRDAAKTALIVYAKIDSLKKFRSVAESFYAKAHIVVDNTANNQQTLSIPKDEALVAVDAQISQQEAELRSLGFDPE